MSKKKNKKKQNGKSADKKINKLSRSAYENEIVKLQEELVRLQDWIKFKGLRVIVIFEGRDAAGKGGVIKRISEKVSPRIFRVVALPAPNDREKSQLYIQRYLAHFPAAGEMVIFDRSWYNRLGVERVMGFCSENEYRSFLSECPRFESYVVNSGIILIKYFFDVSMEEQASRFLKRINDPARHWKLSPMDTESYRLWWDYTAAYESMIASTDTDHAPWNIVKADNKRSARLNCIAHLLSTIPYEKTPYKKPELPERKKKDKDNSHEINFRNWVPEVY
ncbi:MAG: polyphosphate kinase 2 [Cyclobacteriaceae bacterium]|nr:polyphosphate kinase 2 [Cyclobacteriaceae bacterium]